MFGVAEQAERLAGLVAEHVAVPEDRLKAKARVRTREPGREQQHATAGLQPGKGCGIEVGCD